MVDLTQKEKEIYQYISECLEKNRYAPSVRDICGALNIKSTSSVHEYLRRLETKGYIKKSSGKSRALSIENGKYSESARIERVPILGRVTAGQPILAVENYEGYVDFPSVMARGKANLFALRVMGESMIDAGILDGDIVVVESKRYADDGDIVVAMIDDEATVKRFFAKMTELGYSLQIEVWNRFLAGKLPFSERLSLISDSINCQNSTFIEYIKFI